jgi:cytidylate kinase
MIIAIDGPAGSGKGTLGRKLAVYLELPFLDSGKLYRYVALVANDLNVDPNDNAGIERVLEEMSAERLDNPRLSSGIAGVLAAKYSKVPQVRDAITDAIRTFANRSEGAVIDGRDIGTVVLPSADVKLYVTAAPEVRACRRHRELISAGHTATYENILAEINSRDRADIERPVAPLKPAQDAYVLDTTHLGIDEAFSVALRVVEAARDEKQ